MTGVQAVDEATQDEGALLTFTWSRPDAEVALEALKAPVPEGCEDRAFVLLRRDALAQYIEASLRETEAAWERALTAYEEA